MERLGGAVKDHVDVAAGELGEAVVRDCRGYDGLASEVVQANSISSSYVATTTSHSRAAFRANAWAIGPGARSIDCTRPGSRWAGHRAAFAAWPTTGTDSNPLS